MSWPGSDTLSRGSVPKSADLGGYSISPLLRPLSGVSSPQAPLETGEVGIKEEAVETSKISAYARLDFDHYTFFVQTLQVVLGRKSSQEFLSSAHHSVDVHLSSKKAISRRHAKIFYNFGTQRFEISVLGRNGAFVNDSFIGKGITVPLLDSTKIQIGDIPFSFVLPSVEPSDAEDANRGPTSKMFNPSDALNLRSNLYSGSASPKKTPKKSVSLAADTIKKESSEITQRRNSKADIVRRLSIARRKSLASSSNDEINALLKELETLHEGESGTSSLSDKDFDASMLDEDMKQILHGQGQLANTEYEKEDDEIDRLVKQHNLGEDGTSTHAKLPKDLAMDINILDQEVASLVPLIDGNQNRDTPSNLFAQGKSGITKTSALHHLDPLDRASSLMGKPAQTPRMGKPATIQPPPNRVYGRTPMNQTPMTPQNGHLVQNPQTLQNYQNLPINATPQGSLGNAPPRNAPLGSAPYQRSADGANIPGHTQMSGLADNSPGYQVTSTPGYPAYTGYSPAYPPIVRPPPPRLEVEVETITCVPVTEPVLPFRAITINFGVSRRPPICVYKTAAKVSSKLKIPIRRKDAPRKVAKTQNPKDAPDQFKTKPAVSISTMIVTVLRTASPDKKGLTTSEVHEKIKEYFPYYKFCPDGWQFPVTHNLRFNKTFVAVYRPELESEWQYAIDHSYLEEKERVRKIQQEAASARAKEAALRAADYRSRPMAHSYGHLGRPFVPMPERSQNQPHVQFPLPPGPSLPMSHSGTAPGPQRPKSIAEIASEIKRDGPHSFNKPPLYFQRKAPETKSSEATGPQVSDHERYSGTIKDQLAANRAKNPPSLGSPTPVPQLGKPPSSASAVAQNKGATHVPKISNQLPRRAPSPAVTPKVAANPPKAASPRTPSATTKPAPSPMNGDTKKSLAYLQKELFTLYKARNLTYNTTVTTEIITKALATTIAQVNIIGAKAGCGDNALSFLVEKAPQQVSKILDIALTKSIKEKQGVLSGQSSGSNTPQPSAPPTKTPSSLGQPHTQGHVNGPSTAVKPVLATTTNTKPSSLGSATPSAHSNSPRGGQTQTPSRGAYLGLSKPQSFTKPGAGLARPGQYINNKPRPVEKRPSDEPDRGDKKVTKRE